MATPSALAPEAHPDMLIARARRLGLPLVRVTSLGEGMRDAELAPLEIEDLLLRPTVQIDRRAAGEFHSRQARSRHRRRRLDRVGNLHPRGGVRRQPPAGPRELRTVAAPHSRKPAVLSSDTQVDGDIADVRDRERVREVMSAFRPDVVFHAAALKHVPYLEKNWTEGIKTNVFGSMNVADAAVEAGAARAGDDLHRQGHRAGLDARRHQALRRDVLPRRSMPSSWAGTASTRLIAVRFGNVLGSVGSVVPKFKAQIARGGPVTVTHPDMVRYFMTTREAADLVLTSASHADKGGRLRHDGSNRDERASVYVLKMGQPVRIIELAERMIRLAGFEPGEEIEIAVTGTRPASACTKSCLPARSPAPRSASTA